MTVRWTKAALTHLANLMAYIERDSPLRAKSFVQEIRAKTTHLATFPALGRLGRVAGTRELVVHENYIVTYRLRDDGDIDIVRVRHVARRWR